MVLVKLVIIHPKRLFLKSTLRSNLVNIRPRIVLYMYKLILKNFSSILHIQFNHYTLPGTPFNLQLQQQHLLPHPPICRMLM